MKVTKSKYTKETLAEPLILEPEDWSFQEWATICKLCSLPLGRTERIVLHTSKVECFVDLSKKALDCGRTYTVTEMCPNCESEIEMRWDTDKMGFYAFCPLCGNRLMLCDECRHSGEGPCDYDGKTDSCRHNPALPGPNVLPTAMRMDTPLGAIIVRAADDPDHPGIWIDLRRPDADQDMPLATVEFSQDESDRPDGERNIVTHVWGDGEQEGYTNRIVHKGIEEYFRTEEVENP